MIFGGEAHHQFIHRLHAYANAAKATQPTIGFATPIRRNQAVSHHKAQSQKEFDVIGRCRKDGSGTVDGAEYPSG